MKIVVSPAALPVSVDEVKEYLRIDIDEEEDLLESLIVAAVAYVEEYTNRALITQTWDELLKVFPVKNYYQIPKTPFVSLEAAEYMGEGDTTYTDFTDILTVDTYNDRVYLNYSETWPCYILEPGGGVRFEWTCGYADDGTYDASETGAGIPEPIKQAIKLLVAHWYENREPILIGAIAETLQFTIKALLAPYRVVTFA